ncbi:hypothetical protein ACPUEN_06045 [Algoriphagus yeomjeoni]|uniref:hypothetical protein n=1 Tax=Algoriphagus yeomjeoni TaxID=291403 RepID=UPI003CE55FAD
MFSQLEMIVDLEFIIENSQTIIDMVSFPHQVSDASKKVFEEDISNMEQRFIGTFDQLNNYLSK